MGTERKIKELTAARNTSKLVLPWLEKYYRAEYKGLENIPDCPFIGLGNHLGIYFLPETYLWLGKYHRLESKPPMKVLIHNMLHRVFSFLKLPEDEFGVLDADPESALKALKSGYAVTVYPGGDRENSKPFSERNKIDFYNHTGYIQLALKARVPILPVTGIGGGETLFTLFSGEKIAELTGLAKYFKVHTWPVYWSFPCGWHIGHFPFFSIPMPSQVTISILPPYSIEKYAPEDAGNLEVLNKINTDIIQLMQAEMDRLAEGRIPILGKPPIKNCI